VAGTALNYAMTPTPQGLNVSAKGGWNRG